MNNKRGNFEVLDKQNFEPKYRVFTIFVGAKIYCLKDKIFEER
jgi:hypothetical protein